ncbi:MAG: RnfABCDGE type electron transport complex subunit G [Candidatus Omnitrophota bacterium]
MLKYGVILGLICLIAAGLLATANVLTKPRIAAEAEKEISASLQEVLPEARNFEPIKFQNEIIYYKGFDKNNSLAGLAFIARGKGYSSVIETMAGMKPDGTITAVKVLSQSETPGLGSRICEIEDNTTIFDALKGKRPDASLKPWFQQQFSNKKNNEIDGINAITGATISSRAVINAVKTKALEIQKLAKP